MRNYKKNQKVTKNIAFDTVLPKEKYTKVLLGKLPQSVFSMYNTFRFFIKTKKNNKEIGVFQVTFFNFGNARVYVVFGLILNCVTNKI